MHRAIRNALPLAVVGLAALMLTGCPPSLTVEAGLDLYETVADDSKGNPQVMIEASIIELAEDSIPLNFFDTGSDPFGGTIKLQGNPLGSTTQCESSIGNTDTIIERKQDAELPRMNSEATVPIQLLELSLVCVDPIIVTYNGTSTEQWDLFVTLNPTMQSNGNMTIRRTSRDGGPSAPRSMYIRD